MKIKVYVIDLEMPRWAKRALVVGGAFAAVLVGATALVHADTVSVPNTFQDGETLSADKMNANFNALRDAINNANPDCPRGYAKVGPAASFLPASIVCKKGDDEVVKVGTGASAFWIDRYEASVWDAASGGTQIADNDDAAYGNAGLPQNGQVVPGTALYARSVANVMPSRAMTWFRAMEACAASGKQLPDGQQWLRAARGTADPGSNNGMSNAMCNTSASPSSPRKTGKGVGNEKPTSCISDWGAEDMIGNLWEWTAEWYAAPSASASLPSAKPWPSAGNYGGDGTWGISSYAYDGYTTYVHGLPAAALRGGDWSPGTEDGVFSLYLGDAPSLWGGTVGLRCVVPSS